MQRLKANGRYIIAFFALLTALLLSVKFSDRGVEFNIKETPLSASENKVNTSKLEILSKVILHLKKNYVDRSRFKPNKMLIYGLDEVQNSIAEVVISFNKDKDDKPTQVTVQVNGKSQAFQIKNTSSLWEMKLRFTEIFGFIQANLKDVPDIKFNEIEYAAINGMLSTLDPHSILLPPRNFEEMQTQTGGKFGGLGIVISIRDGQLTVISPIDGTPASRKGIKARDRIVRISDVSTINMNLSEAVGMMRGKVGMPIDLWIMRKSWTEARKFTIIRAEIKIDSVESQPLGDKVGYIKIKNFQANTVPDLKKNLKQLKEKMGGMEGLVLDLRNNPGGLLDQAIKVSDLFIKDGIIVSTVGVGNRLREKQSARKFGTEPVYPIIVLLSPGSASASEIVAGALQNHNRAIILGTRSFGKGSVQVLYDFPDGSALKLTIAQYLTPGGISIQGRGILPDIKVLPVSIEKKHVDIFLSTHIIREGDLGQHLTNSATNRDTNSDKPKQALSNISNSNTSKVPFIQYFEKQNKDKKDGYDDGKFTEDYEIRLAQRFLSKSLDVVERKKMIENLSGELKKVSDLEYKKVKKELKKLKVDWTKGPSVKDAKLTINTEISNKGIIEAGKKVTLKVSVKNEGEEKLFQLKAISKADTRFLDDREFIFGALAPGQSKSWTLELEIPKDVSSRFDLMYLKFSDATFSYPQIKKTVNVNIVASDRPRFAFSYDAKDSSGDKKLSIGDTVKFNVTVRNVGKADSAETFVYLKNLSGKSIYLKKGRQKLKKIEKGKSEIVEFEFDIKDVPKDGKNIEMEIDIYDTAFREYTEKKFKIPFDVKAKNTNAKTKMYQPPNIFVKAASQITDASKIKITGKATDESAIRDYYVFVYNRAPTKINTKKIFYMKGKGAELDISLDVPLFKGMNRIAVVARDDDNMGTTRTVYVYRK